MVYKCTAHLSSEKLCFRRHTPCCSGLGSVRLGSSGLGRLSIYDAHKMRWDELHCATVRLGSGWGSCQILLIYDLCIRLPVPAGAFSRGPRGCQAHPNQGVAKYHTLRLPDPNSSVNFRMSRMSSDDSSGFGWAQSNASSKDGGVLQIRMSPIERALRPDQSIM